MSKESDIVPIMRKKMIAQSRIAKTKDGKNIDETFVNMMSYYDNFGLYPPYIEPFNRLEDHEEIKIVTNKYYNTFTVDLDFYNNIVQIHFSGPLIGIVMYSISEEDCY